MSDLPESADVIIVWGGSAGAVLAARLSQDPAQTVLLLEAGHAYAPDAFPASLLDAGILHDQDHDWGYTSRATDQAPRIAAARGKGLGGSSAVNAGVAVRPRPADFAKWGAHGADGWSFAEVLPAFKLMENNPAGEDAYHGRTGPLPVRQLTEEELTPSQAGFIDAALARGFKKVHDFNGADQDGVGGHSVDVADGIRQNTAITGELDLHPTTTAPMGGPADLQTVVDPVGAVKQVSALRVVDASVIPDIPSTVTNLAVMMLAERIYQRVYQA
jgi:choline dehydrogenase